MCVNQELTGLSCHCVPDIDVGEMSTLVPSLFDFGTGSGVSFTHVVSTLRVPSPLVTVLDGDHGAGDTVTGVPGFVVSPVSRWILE